MMQETLLRVFVVALGLLMSPRDDPGVEELEHIVTRVSQKHEEWLLREEKKLDQVMQNNDNKGPEDVMTSIPEEQKLHVFEKDDIIDLDVPVSERDSEEHSVDHKLPDELDSFLPEKCNSEPEITMKISHITHEKKESDILDDGSTKEEVRPQMQLKRPEEEELGHSKEPESPLSHDQNKPTLKETSEKALAEWEKDYLWYIWNTFSIISIIRFFKKYLQTSFQMTQQVNRAFPMICTAAEVPLPDVGTLQHFYAQCVEVSVSEKWREDEFLEGFTNDLIEAMNSISEKDGRMMIQAVKTLNMSDIRVVFTPPEPYHFQCLFGNNQASDLLSDMQICGQIKLMEERKIKNGCPCQTSDVDDMVCLLHCESDKVRKEITEVCDGPFCSKSTPFLSKLQVTRWFQSTIKQAWALISHKYEFELNIRYIEAPGALVIRFRSGKKISFTMNPVVKFNNDAHLFITPWSSSELDTFWTLSLTLYEDSLLKHLSKTLPENSCHNQVLEIACFLLKRQISLSGSCGLKDFHFKTALMHLLLNKNPSQWRQDDVTCRLRDLLAFMERSLERKMLNHVLIGNPLAGVIELPTEFIKAKPVNLFHPLVVHSCIYKNAIMHFQEMLRYAKMIIHDFVAQ